MSKNWLVMTALRLVCGRERVKDRVGMWSLARGRLTREGCFKSLYRSRSEVQKQTMTRIRFHGALQIVIRRHYFEV